MPAWLPGKDEAKVRKDAEKIFKGMKITGMKRDGPGFNIYGRYSRSKGVTKRGY